MFTGFRPGEGLFRNFRVPFPPPGQVPPNDKIADANPNTFYSAMSNIDFEIGDGNPAAVAVRFHVAQHSLLSHMDFRIGSGLAGIYMVGNEAEDLHFYGGRYGILTEKTSPAWQFTLLDSTFDGQREAAIREHEAQLTLVHDTFRNMPTAIDIDQGYPDELWVSGVPLRAHRARRRRDQRRTESAHRDRIRERRVPAMCRRSPVFASRAEPSPARDRSTV